MTIAVTQSLELYDVNRTLLDIAHGINDAARRLLRILGDLVSPDSQDPDERDVSGCERKRDSAQPSIERRSHGQVRRDA
jgi:hypothetical protein